MTSLTFLDPLAAILLFVKPRFGIILTVAIMVVDVVHNVWIVMTYGGATWMVVCQAIFLAYILITVRFAWRA